MNLIQLIKDQLSGELIAKLSSALGESEAKTRTAATAAVPSLLSVLANLVSSGTGAEKLVSTLRGLDPGLQSNPGGMLRSQPSVVQEMGGKLLGSLLGGGGLGDLVNALTKFSGLAPGASKGLLSYLAPLILGMIANQFKNKALTPQGLSSLFAEQKSHIAEAIPSGFPVGDLTRLADVKVPEAGLPKWLLPALALGALALAAWYFFGRNPEPPPVANTTPPVPEVAAEVKPKIEPAADGAVLAKDLGDVYKTAMETLTGVKDAATAEAALPKIEGLNTTLDRLKGLWDKLPEAGRSAVTAVTRDSLDKLKELVAKVLAIPGVGEKLKPLLDALVTKLTGLA
jgi:hypothetical protein